MRFLTEEDLKKIQGELNISLPDHYRIFHETKSFLIKELRETDSCPEDDTLSIATDADYIIKINRFSGLPSNEGPARNKFAIGGDGCGSTSLIDLQDHFNETVYFIPHDEYEFEEIFDEEKNDFRWDHKGLTVANNLEEYITKEISRNIEYRKMKK